MIVCRDACFTLHTAHTSYQLCADEQGRLLHTYYGARLPDDAPNLRPTRAPHAEAGRRLNLLPFECSAPGTGDFRTPAVLPEYADGSLCADLQMVGAQVTPGKYELPGLPAFRGAEQTLCVTLRDCAGLEVELRYAVFPQHDVITRAAVYRNTGAAPLSLRKASSLCLDFDTRPLDMITLHGKWSQERTPERAPLRYGVQSVGSMQGVSSHAHNPAVALCRPDADEEHGDCWGFALVYSGNFLCEAERSESGNRLVMGIHPHQFCWTLAPGESFVAPEVAMVYAADGLGGMRRCFHRAIRAHLLPERWRDMNRPRPVLLNSWEACYFRFDQDRLLALAEAAARAGIDLFVLDDGWFKGRDADNSSLGDWVADVRKLPEGLEGLCRRLQALGLDFGLWIEPEAVSPDSDLFRLHPDWALRVPGRTPLTLRNQYVLDFSRPEVVQALWEQLHRLLSSCPIRYIKWDMNRKLSDVYSAALPADRQGEVYHRYMLGVYALQKQLTEAFPDLLLENCAAGGGRFDCGMLCYSPQIWCSDNTDARSRLSIQYGTSLFYPPCTMGSHFSIVPNHYTGRTASVEARMACALFGTFGFELDLTGYSPEALAELRPYIDWYRAHGALLRGGDLYGLLPPDAAGSGAAWWVVSPDRDEAAVFAGGEARCGVERASTLPSPPPRLPLRGLCAQSVYEDADGVRYAGAQLLAAGLPLPTPRGDVPAYLCYLRRTADPRTTA